MPPKSHAPLPPGAANSPAPPAAPSTETAQPAAALARFAPPKEAYIPMFIAVAGVILGELFASALPPNYEGMSVGASLGWIFAAGLLIVAIYSLVVQWRFFSNGRRLLRRLQIVLLAGTAALIPLAAVVGDIAGGAAYHTPSEISFYGLIILSAVSAGVMTVIVATGNALYALTRFHTVTRVIGYIAFVLCWLAVVFAAYVTYMTVYSLHDPSSE